MSAGFPVHLAHLLGMPQQNIPSRSRSSGDPDGPSRADRAAKSASTSRSSAASVAGKSKADRNGNSFRFAHLARAAQPPTPAPVARRDAETPDAVARRCLAAAGIATTPLSLPTVASKPPTYATADAAARAGLRAAGLTLPK